MQERQAEDELTPLSRQTSRFWWGWGIAVALTVLIVVLVTVPPYVEGKLRLLLMEGFSVVCHQLPGRSPHLNGVQLAVCHRCYGIYWGLLLAVLGFLVLLRWSRAFSRRAPLWLMLSLVPLTLDWMLGVLGIWQNTPVSRTVTGMIFGLAAGYFFAQACTQLFKSRPVNENAHAGVTS